MKTRLYVSGDYPTVEKWWAGHKQAAVPANVLPKCGVVVENNGKPLAAAWLYQDNSVGVAWLAWLVSNPEASPFVVAEALEVLFGATERVARDLQYGLMFTMTERGSLGRWLQRHGFAPNHRGVTQYFKPLA